MNDRTDLPKVDLKFLHYLELEWICPKCKNKVLSQTIIFDGVKIVECSYCGEIYQGEIK